MSTEERAGLGARITSAHDAVVAAQFQDVNALVELARLQLRRDDATSDADGNSDAERAKKNAMRAVAVDGSSPAAKLVLALTLSRTLRDVKARAARFALLELIELVLPSEAEGSVGAATATMKGLIALERGDAGSAKQSFERATKLDGSLASAWVGLGDVARATGAFDEARANYERAIAIQADGGVKASLEAANRGEALVLASSSKVEGAPKLTPGALLTAKASAPACSAEARAVKEAEPLCSAMDRLGAATGPQRSASAAEVLRAAVALQEACGAKRPACGKHVAEAHVAAARAFAEAGALAKAIAALRMSAAPRHPIPGAEDVATAALCELGDMYFALGVFDQAADWYEKHIEASGSKSREATERVVQIRLALGQHDRVRQLLERGGQRARADALLKEEARGACGPLFGCTAFRLAGEARWSAFARQP